MNENPKRKTNIKKAPNLIAGAFVILSVGAAAFLGWQSFQLKQSEQELIIAIENQKETLITLKEREKIGEKMKAAEILNKAKVYRKDWSVVLKDLNQAFPERGEIKFRNVAVDATDTVTVQGTASDITNAARFLSLVKSSNNLSDGFISTISPASNGLEGNTTYNFNASFQYEPTTQTKALTTDES
jgi:Tfp pilus assembly protein PilN